MKPQNSEAPSRLQVGKPARSLGTGSFPNRVSSATFLQGGLRGYQVGRRCTAGTGMRRATLLPVCSQDPGLSSPAWPRSGLRVLASLAAALRVPGPVRMCLYACACLGLCAWAYIRARACACLCACTCACVHAGAPRPQRSLLQKLLCPLLLCLPLPEVQLPAAQPRPRPGFSWASSPQDPRKGATPNP